MRLKALLFLLIAIVPYQSFGANYYVLDGGTSSACTTWADACDQLSTAETVAARGDTIWVGDGSYGAVTFNTPINGTQYITVKKATASAHGTETGWDNTYGDGVATFTGVWDITTSYWDIDGVTGGGPGSWDSGLGFKISSTGRLIEIQGAISNIFLRHIEATDASGANITGQTDCLYATGGASNITVQYNYWHDVSSTGILSRNSNGLTFEFSKFEYNGDYDNLDGAGVQRHKEFWSLSADSNATIRYSIFEDVSNTGWIGNVNGTGVSDNVYIYGNVVYHSQKANRNSRMSSLMSLGYSSGMTISNWKFYNNSIININQDTAGGNAGITGSGTNGGGNAAGNNIFYLNHANSVAYSTPLGFAATADYDYYSENIRTEGCSPTCDIDDPHNEANAQVATGSPFTNWTSADFSLLAATTAGDNTLGSPYDADPLGNTRGADGAWDRGAYEYTGADVSPPVRSNGSPTGTLAADTTSTTISLTTSENATCKWGTVADTAYASIANTFDGGGTTSHSDTVTGLTNGGSFSYYVRCQDATPNTNSDDYTISFSVANPTPPEPAGDGSVTYKTSAPSAISGSWQ